MNSAQKVCPRPWPISRCGVEFTAAELWGGDCSLWLDLINNLRSKIPSKKRGHFCFIFPQNWGGFGLVGNPHLSEGKSPTRPGESNHTFGFHRDGDPTDLGILNVVGLARQGPTGWWFWWTTIYLQRHHKILYKGKTPRGSRAHRDQTCSFQSC